MLIALRPASVTDLAFIYEVTEASMRGYVEQTWGQWHRALQLEHVEKSFDPATHRVLLVDDEPADLVAVSVHESHMELEKLYLSLRFQNRGIGSHVVKQLLVTAASTGKPVRLRVLKVNESAQRFYRRHSFVVTSVSLERVFMEVPAG
jgi:ribosomal protein S18 acetylase RimI-like enzyme